MSPRERVRTGGRVVMFLPGLAEEGGAGRRSTLFAAGLAERGWNVRGVARAGTARRPALVRRPNFAVIEIPGFELGRLGALPFMVVGTVLGLWWGRRADAFLAIQATSQATVAAVCGRLWRRPVLVSMSTSGELSEVSLLRERGAGNLRRWLLQGSLVLVQTPTAQEEVLASIRGVDVAVLPNPVVPVVPPPLTGSLRAMFAGRFAAEKDLPLLLDAWRQVIKKETSARLALVGAGGAYRSVEAELRTTIASHATLRHTVELPGWVPDLYPWFARHDVFVFPSRSEGMSNALLEACAAGRVVVASDIAQNVAVLGEDYPLLFRVGDAEELQQLLLLAFRQDVVRNQAREAVLYRANEFAHDGVIDQLERLLIEVRGRHPQNQP